jgi:MFS family permease
MLMIALDATVVNVALPAIQQDLGLSQSGLAWVVNAYLVSFGGCFCSPGDSVTCSRGAGSSWPG